MALFGKKKGEAPTSSSTAPASSSADAGAFDFDAISRDLDAQNGASSFDSLLAQPTGSAPANTPPVSGTSAPVSGTSSSAFDLQDDDPFAIGAPAQPATHLQAQVTPVVSLVPQAAPVAPLPQTVVSAPLGSSPVETLPPSPPVEVPVRPARKSLPLVPLLGGLGLLAVLGGGAMFLLNSQKEPVDNQAPPPPRLAQRPPVAQRLPVAPPAGARPVTVRSATTPGTPALRPSSAEAPTSAALRSASPGIAPPVPATRPRPGGLPSGRLATGGSQIPVRVAQGAASALSAPAIKGPSATQGLDVGLASRLKALWQAGADAKHRGDSKDARASWEEALRLHPGHPGFAQALAKLPR